MDPIAEAQVRPSFINCTKGAASRIAVPRDLAEQPWDKLDFFGWRDQQNPGAAYLIVPEDDGGLAGIVLRLTTDLPPSRRQAMCSACHTVHSSGGVALMVAERAGRSGRDGNTVGVYLCADLACSLYARGLRRPSRVQPHETMSEDDRVERVRENIAAFVRRVRRE